MTEFRKIETSCLLLKDLEHDLVIKEGKYVTWKSRTGHDAEAQVPSSTILKIKGKNALIFKDNWYAIRNICISPQDPNSYASIIITFKVKGEHDQFLVSDCVNNDELLFRGISASKKEIRIWGVKNDDHYLPLKYDSSDWTTICCIWSNTTIGHYYIGTIHGTFECGDFGVYTEYQVLIGARKVDMQIVNSLDGWISAIEIYIKTEASEDKTPISLTDLVMKDQKI